MGIYVYGVIMFVGVLLSLYYWWVMGREEHWDETALFDSFFLSLFAYLIVGRLGYVALHASALNTPYRVLALLSYPGINVVAGALAVCLSIVLLARERGWQVWKALDALAVSSSLVGVFGMVAYALNSRPGWGETIWSVFIAVVTFVCSARVRKNFRFYAWYKHDASVARDGLSMLTMVGMVGVYCLGIPWLRPPALTLWIIPLEFLVGVGLVLLSGYLTLTFSGRQLDLLQWRRKRG